MVASDVSDEQHVPARGQLLQAGAPVGHWPHQVSTPLPFVDAQPPALRYMDGVDGLVCYRNRKDIEDICWSASRELELEVKLRMTEEEWTEQVYRLT